MTKQQLITSYTCISIPAIASLLLVIVSLVFNVLIFIQIKNGQRQLGSDSERKASAANHVKQLASQEHLDLQKELNALRISENNQSATVFCPNYAQANDSQAWQEAARSLGNGLDERVDPCKNFYAFSCGKFMSDMNITELNRDDFGTSSLAQARVYTAIAEALEKVDVKDTEWSETERITKAAYHACMINKELEFGQDASEEIYKYLQDLGVSVPFFNETMKDDFDVFAAFGAFERTFGFGTLMQSIVNVDYKNISQNILYISQPDLPMARDLYVLPHFFGFQNMRSDKTHNIMLAFSMELVDDPSELEGMMKKAAEEIVDLEVQIAKVSRPKREMSIHTEQYNVHTMDTLERHYPNIGWRSYFKNLLALKNINEGALGKVVITQPTYFAWLNSMLATQEFEKRILVNYMIAQLLFDNADFLSVPLNDAFQRLSQDRLRRRRNDTRDNKRRSEIFNKDSIQCMDMVVNYLPFGAGYVYVKSMQNRDRLYDDIKYYTKLTMTSFQLRRYPTYSLRARGLQDIIKLPNWMSRETKNFALKKAEQMRKNLGWPIQLFGDFKNSSSIDTYHRKDYYAIIDAYNTNNEDFYTIMKILKTSLKNRENLRKLKEKPNRKRFEDSPAKVRIKYRLEKNSLTIPLAGFAHELFNHDYPRTYTIASRVIAVSQELAKAFDEEGIQFDADGSLYRKWMDLESDFRYMRMKECVILQYSSQCCIKNYDTVRCNKGENTERQNIADIGGLLAAYKAFTRYVKKGEFRLPGLERYTPEQTFWITYGNSLCTLQSNLSRFVELQEGSYSPSECRVNVALQNIPAFANAFKCMPETPMAPTSDKQCPVWRKE